MTLNKVGDPLIGMVVYWGKSWEFNAGDFDLKYSLGAMGKRMEAFTSPKPCKPKI